MVRLHIQILVAAILADLAAVPVRANPPAKPDVRWNRLMVSGFNAKDCGNYQAAEQKFIAALRLVNRDDDPRKSATLRMLGDCYAENGKISGARYCYEQDVKLSQSLGDDCPNLVYDIVPLSRLLIAQGENKDAEKALLTVLPIARQNDLIPELAEAFEILGCVYLQENEPKKAQTISRQLEQLPYSIKTACPCINLAACFSKNGDDETSSRLLHSAIAFGPKSLHAGSDGTVVGEAACSLALRYMARKQYGLAENVLRRGLLLEHGPGFNNMAVLANINSWLAICLVDEKKRRSNTISGEIDCHSFTG